MTVESSMGIGVPVGLNRRAPDRPFSNLSPVDSVVQRITSISGEFSPLAQMLILKAHGLNGGKIGQKLGVSERSVFYHLKDGQATGYAGIAVTMSLVNEGKIPPDLLTKGLDFDKYSLLTPREKDVLELISKKEMWEAKIPAGVRHHLLQIYKKVNQQAV